MVLNSLHCAEVPLRNCSLTHSHSWTPQISHKKAIKNILFLQQRWTDTCAAYLAFRRVKCSVLHS